MAGELNAMRDGMPITLHFQATDPAANATTNLITDLTGAGYVVPAGYVFHPMLLQVTGDTAVTAGTATFNVTDNTVAVANGPAPVLSSAAGATLSQAAMARFGANPIAAGHIVGVNIVASAGYLPVTDDFDALLHGVLALA